MEDFQPQSVPGPDGNTPQDTPVVVPEGSLAPEQPSSGGFKNFIKQNKWYVVAIVLGVLIIGVLAAVAFWPRQEQSRGQAQVSLAIDAPETTQAGGEVIYRIQILNQDPAKLIDMNLELVYDDGVSYVSSSPKAENLSGTSFKVPDLANGQNAVVIVKTLAQGNVNDQKRLVARLRYRFDNFSSSFTSETSHQTRLVAANVILDFSGRNQINAGEQVSFDLSYRNTSNRTIENSRIQITYPSSFKFGAGDPAPSLGNNIWNLGSLSPNQAGKISFTGTMGSSQVGQKYELVAEFLVPDDEGNYFTQSSNIYPLEISQQPLSVEASVSSSAQGGIVKPGSSVSVDLKFNNNSNVVHTGLQLLAEVESGSVEPGSLQTDSGFVSDQLVNWNGSSSPLLEQLAVGDSGTLRMRFNVANPATTTDTKNLTIKIRPRIKSNQNEQFISGGEIELKISSPSALTNSVSHAGGPLPPLVGQQSSFTVRLILKNSSNDYRNGVLTALVPVGVNLDTNSISASERNLVKFDSSTGRLTWELGQLLAHSGVLRPERSLEFTVRVTPSSSQVGQALELLRGIEFQAVDSFTEENIKLNNQDINTNALPSGQNGRVTQ